MMNTNGASAGRQAAHIRQMMLKVVELGGYRRRDRRCLLRTDAGYPEHLQELSQSRSDFGVRTPALRGTPTNRQMTVKKALDHRLANVRRAKTTSRKPMNKVSNASEISLDRLGGIAALGKILNVRSCCICERCGRKPLLAGLLSRPETCVPNHGNSPREG
jgi:hypothetical protein